MHETEVSGLALGPDRTRVVAFLCVETALLQAAQH